MDLFLGYYDRLRVFFCDRLIPFYSIGFEINGVRVTWGPTIEESTNRPVVVIEVV